MNIEVIYIYLQEWAIEADRLGPDELSQCLFTAAEAAGDAMHTDDEDDAE